MKPRQPKDIIKKELAIIDKLTGKKKIDNELLHKLRTTYKKLRALVRMQLGMGNAKVLPAPLNKLYKTAGNIRDLLLHVEYIKEATREKNSYPEAYIKTIKKEAAKHKKKLKAHFKDFDKKGLSKEILDALPKEATGTKDLLRWQRQQYVAIKKLAVKAHTDKTIHDIRKRVKDVLYVFTHAAEQAYVKQIERLEILAADLGQYQDYGVQLQILKEHTAEILPEESIVLKKAAQIWTAGKKRLKKRILKNLSLE